MQKKVSSSVVVTTDYLNGFQYVKTGTAAVQLEFFPHAEGYVNVVNGERFNYVYNYTDHLGNIRVSYGLDPESNVLKILEENHYYPFGMKHKNYGVDMRTYQQNNLGQIRLPLVSEVSYKYKYNGKEWQDELGLNVTAMDFRMYDNALGRFYNIDAMAEIMPFISPYRFAFNNPVIWKDPTGLSEDPPIKTIHLDEVVVSAKRKTPSRTYEKPKDFGNYSLLPGRGRDKFKGNTTIYEMNKKYGTDFKDFDDWYYRTKHLPFEKDMYRSMHDAQNAAGKVVAVVVGSAFALPFLLGAPVVTAISATITQTLLHKHLLP